MSRFLGLPYPTTPNPQGYWYSQSGIDQIKSDMLVLLLTSPGERVMLPNFGTPLKELFFEPNDPATALKARQMIIKSISDWEPRVAVTNIQVSTTIDKASLNSRDDLTEREHILYIKINFVDPENIREVQELALQVPLS